MGAVPILAGLSFIKGISDQEAARKDLRSAEATGQKLTQRQIDLYDKMFAEGSKALDQLDYDKIMAERRGVIDRTANVNMKNIGAGLRTQGYKPGETPSTLAFQRAQQQYFQTLADTEQQLKAQIAAQRMGILGQINPSILNPALSQATQQQNFAQQNFQNSNPFAATLPYVQYLFPEQQPSGETGQTKR